MIRVVCKPADDTDYEAYANNALSHALRAAQIAKIINVDQNNKPVKSAMLESVLYKNVYVICGPKEYGGAIKGHAFLGYLEHHCSVAQNEIDDAPLEIQQRAKTDFLLAHGISLEQINDEVLAQVSNTHVALWQSFKDRAIIAPTSGSFGIAAYETIEKLRNAEISLIIDGRTKTINLLSEHEGGARAWAPDISTGCMTQEKIDVLDGVAARVNLPVMKWIERDTRDHFALLDALIHGDYFCPTNPKSAGEVATLLNDILINSYAGKNGRPIIFTEGTKFANWRDELIERIKAGDAQTITALKYNGISLQAFAGEELSLIVQEPISAGIFGLMLGRLRHLDVISENSVESELKKFHHKANEREKYLARHPEWFDPKILHDETYEQPSVGATLAGAIVADSIALSAAGKNIRLSPQNHSLLQEFFPNIATAIKDAKMPNSKFLRTGCS